MHYTVFLFFYHFLFPFDQNNQFRFLAKRLAITAAGFFDVTKATCAPSVTSNRKYATTVKACPLTSQKCVPACFLHFRSLNYSISDFLNLQFLRNHSTFWSLHFFQWTVHWHYGPQTVIFVVTFFPLTILWSTLVLKQFQNGRQTE